MREPEKETEAEGGEGGNKWWYDNREIMVCTAGGILL